MANKYSRRSRDMHRYCKGAVVWALRMRGSEANPSLGRDPRPVAINRLPSSQEGSSGMPTLHVICNAIPKKYNRCMVCVTIHPDRASPFYPQRRSVKQNFLSFLAEILFFLLGNFATSRKMHSLTAQISGWAPKLAAPWTIPQSERYQHPDLGGGITHPEATPLTWWAKTSAHADLLSGIAAVERMR